MMRVFDEVSCFLVLDLRGESNNWEKTLIVPNYPTSPERSYLRLPRFPRSLPSYVILARAKLFNSHPAGKPSDSSSSLSPPLSHPYILLTALKTVFVALSSPSNHLKATLLFFSRVIPTPHPRHNLTSRSFPWGSVTRLQSVDGTAQSEDLRGY